MKQYIEKAAVENILRNLWQTDNGQNSEHRICYNKALQEVQCKLDTIEVKEVEECKQPEYSYFESYSDREGEHANFRNKIQIGDKVTRNKDGALVNLSQLNRVAK